MNVIGLTGANMHAMADAAELLLAAVAAASCSVAVMLYIDCAAQVKALRAHAQGHTEIWRIGPDPERGHLDAHVDAFLADGESLAHEIEGQLARFIHNLRRLPAPTLS